jgi:large subunit ribosomal protein L21
MKYAVLTSGGKQYIAREGENIDVDRLHAEVGQAVEFSDVLLVVDNDKVKVGSPFVKGAKVKGEIVDQFKAPKVIVFKFIPKERYRRKQGHRQRYTRVAVNKIQVTAPRKKAATPKEAEKPKTTRKTKPRTTKASQEATPRKRTSTKKDTGAVSDKGTKSTTRRKTTDSSK